MFLAWRHLAHHLTTQQLEAMRLGARTLPPSHKAAAQSKIEGHEKTLQELKTDLRKVGIGQKNTIRQKEIRTNKHKLFKSETLTRVVGRNIVWKLWIRPRKVVLRSVFWHIRFVNRPKNSFINCHWSCNDGNTIYLTYILYENVF